MGAAMSRVRAWLDASPLAAVGLALMREATGRAEPLEQVRPTRPERLAPTARIGLWSLAGGIGGSTTAALIAQRSSAGGHAPLLVDLDRWAPSLALRASLEAASVVDALMQPERERDLVSRWGEVPFLAGSPDLHHDYDALRIGGLLDRIEPGRAQVLDLGTGSDALDGSLLARLTRLCVVSGGHASSLQALFCSRALLRSAPCAIGLVLVGVEAEDASLVAGRAQTPLVGVIPHDAYLARDEFAARAGTMRAIDALIRAIN
jgi:MinD-like ATPase involved in chromosome partitioning or flagellar assembly